MLCEYRSNDRECLETMRVFFEKTFEAYRAMGVEVEVTLVGDRPCGGDVPQEKLDGRDPGYLRQRGGGPRLPYAAGGDRSRSAAERREAVDAADAGILRDLSDTPRAGMRSFALPA